MVPTSTPPQDKLTRALLDFVRHPHRTLLANFGWKTAAMSATFRAIIFLFANRHAGGRSALTATLVEATFAIFASGLLGAVVQRLRNTRPLWVTALLVWLGMPLLMSAAQWAVHDHFGTQHMRAGLITSFLFASLASGFTWFAMRRGTLLMGDRRDSLAHDARMLPRLLLDFVLWPFRQTRRT